MQSTQLRARERHFRWYWLLGFEVLTCLMAIIYSVIILLLWWRVIPVSATLPVMLAVALGVGLVDFYAWRKRQSSGVRWIERPRSWK